MILCRNTEVKVRSSNGDTDYLDIVAEVLQGDTLVPYHFIICQDKSIKSKKTVLSWQRKEAEGTSQKQLPMPTTPMT